MENKKLKHPRKVHIEANGTIVDILPILHFANQYKRGDRARVQVREYTVRNFRTGKKVPKVSVTFWTYEPIGQFRLKFHDTIWDTYYVGAVFVEGWYCKFPDTETRWLG